MWLDLKYMYIFIALLGPMTANAADTSFTPDPEDIEYPDDEPPSAEEVELGKILFFDNRLSKNMNQSCATCHNPNLGYSDAVAKGLNTDGKFVARNSPHIYNIAWGLSFTWDGRATDLDKQALAPIKSPKVMGLALDTMVQRLNKVKEYRTRFKKVYNSKITAELTSKALAAFERSIITNNSPFDKYMAGNKSAMNPAAIRGWDLFKGKARCMKCHDGPNFSDEGFHNIGIGDKDLGRGKIINDKTLNGAFKTPRLRNVLLTAPYMHDGSVTTLEEVIRFYNKGGNTSKGRSSIIKKLNLTEQEIYDLVSFLGALTDPVEIEVPKVP